MKSQVKSLESEHQQNVRAKLARLPASVHSVHEKSKQALLTLLKSFFDRTDDSLFELADKALSNQEQNLYFDSMREVRVQRRGIEQRFSIAIDSAFSQLGYSEEDAGQGSINPDELSVVGTEDLEEMMAVDTSVGRAFQEYGDVLQDISARLDSVVLARVSAKNNPLSPKVLYDAFTQEARALKIGIKAKLVLFKLFDRVVIDRLGEIYKSAIDTLDRFGVAASIPASTPSHSQNMAGASQYGRRQSDQYNIPQMPSQNSNGNLNPEVLSTLQSMLGAKPDMSQASPATNASVKAAESELIQLLTRIQQMPTVRNSDVAVNVRSLLGQLEKTSGTSASIGHVDDQVMNLVNLLFDFILEDRNLAAPMKALLSRMQIPIIKVAVADKSFFTQGGHVARRLLNELATAAIGWTGDIAGAKSDPLYRKIDEIIKQLTQEFETDVSIFEELLTEFSVFQEKEKKRAEVLERRTIDAEDGKAKAEVARTTVALEIELRTLDVDLPKVVERLIHEAWKNVMFVTVLKHGFDSDEWRTYLQVLDDLLWSIQPPDSMQHRQQLIQLVPVLLKKLRVGLDSISYNPFEMSDLFKSLEQIHIACIRGRVQQPEKKDAAKKQASVQSQKTATVVAAPIKPKKPEPEPASSMPKVPEPTLHDLARGMQISEAKQEELPKEEEAPAPATEVVFQEALAPDNPYMKQVKKFSQGMWFDMLDDKGVNIRCRLAAYIKPSGKYIFVNRSGMKVAEKTQEDLAIALRDDKLSMLDNTMLFDRALETVVTSLRKN